MSHQIPVSILFCEKNSIYNSLNVDVWDLERDALKFSGSNPVIAHPPCRLFSRLRGLSKAPILEKELAYFAINQVRKNGGILEHPASSTLFKTHLPKPGSVDEFGGFSICINQSWFGHLADKKTLLYFCKIKMSNIHYSPNFQPTAYAVGGKTRTGKKELNKNKNSSTPPQFAKWMIDLCLTIN